MVTFNDLLSNIYVIFPPLPRRSGGGLFPKADSALAGCCLKGGVGGVKFGVAPGEAHLYHSGSHIVNGLGAHPCDVPAPAIGLDDINNNGFAMDHTGEGIFCHIAEGLPPLGCVNAGYPES